MTRPFDPEAVDSLVAADALAPRAAAVDEPDFDEPDFDDALIVALEDALEAVRIFLVAGFTEAVATLARAGVVVAGMVVAALVAAALVAAALVAGGFAAAPAVLRPPEAFVFGGMMPLLDRRGR